MLLSKLNSVWFPESFFRKKKIALHLTNSDAANHPKPSYLNSPITQNTPLTKTKLSYQNLIQIKPKSNFTTCNKKRTKWDREPITNIEDTTLPPASNHITSDKPNVYPKTLTPFISANSYNSIFYSHFGCRKQLPSISLKINTTRSHCSNPKIWDRTNIYPLLSEMGNRRGQNRRDLTIIRTKSNL